MVRSLNNMVRWRHTLPWSSSTPLANCGPPLFNTITHSTSSLCCTNKGKLVCRVIRYVTLTFILQLFMCKSSKYSFLEFDTPNSQHRATQFVQCFSSLTKELHAIISQNIKNSQFVYQLNNFLPTWLFIEAIVIFS